jgi:hypothetical protein
MKWRTLVALGATSLVGCSFSPRTDPEPLQPLPTTGLTELSPVRDPRSLVEREADFIENVRKGYVGAVSKTEEQMLADGRFWCNAYSSGLTRQEINDYASANAVSSRDLTLTRVIITNAFLDLCVEND